MSGLKDIHLTLFFRKLRARRRPLDGTKLARKIFCGRAHLSQVLNGRRAGTRTLAKLRRVLTDDEWYLLTKARDAGAANVPRETISHMEHTQQEVA